MKDRFALAILLSLVLHLLLIEMVSALDFLWPAARLDTERHIIPVTLLEMDSPTDPLTRPEMNESRRSREGEESASSPGRSVKYAGPVTAPRQEVVKLKARPGGGAGPAEKVPIPAEVATCAEPTDRPLPEAGKRQEQEGSPAVSVVTAPADTLCPPSLIPSQDAGRCATAAGTGAAGSGAGSSASGSSEGADEGQWGQVAGKSGRGTIQIPGEFLAGNPPPRYPLLARRKGWEGTVIIDIRISGDGRVREAQVEKSSGYSILDDAALGAVRNWRIAPSGRVDVASFEFRVPVIFKLTSP
jgi:protein TonB